MKKVSLIVSALCLGFAASSVTASLIPASDNAQDAAYGNGWTNGANGGTGFGAWEIITETAEGGSTGVFIGDPAAAGIGGMNAESFGLYSNPAGGNTVVANRDLNLSGDDLVAGSIFSFTWGLNYFSGTKGISLFNDTTWLATFKLDGADAILWNDAASNSGTLANNYGTNAMALSITMTDDSHATVVGTARDGSESINQALDFNGYAPDSFQLFSENLTAGDAQQTYFDNFTVAVPEPVSAALLGLGIGCIYMLRRKLKK